MTIVLLKLIDDNWEVSCKMDNHVAIKIGLNLQLYYSPLIEDQILKMLLILGKKRF